MLPDWLRAVLPADTQHTWEIVRGILPSEAYLVGGTALAVHLHHRLSRDLDFFLEAAVNLDLVESALRRAGPFVVTERDDQTLNGVFSSTSIQVLEAADQRLVEPTITVEGIRVAAVGDLLATKLKVVLDRPALRDYFDLLTIERQAGRYVEEGLALFLQRYRPRVPQQAVAAVVRALGSFGDVPADPGVPATHAEVERYWLARVPDIAAHLDRLGLER